MASQNEVPFLSKHFTLLNLLKYRACVNICVYKLLLSNV